MAAHDLLGKVSDGNLVLLAGPDFTRILTLVEASGMDYRNVVDLSDEQVDDLKAIAADRMRSVALVASMPEIEGRLDRSSFDPRLLHAAYAADRVIYAGPRAAVLIWPEAKGTQRTIRNGNTVVRQTIGTVGPGESIVGITADRL